MRAGHDPSTTHEAQRLGPHLAGKLCRLGVHVVSGAQACARGMLEPLGALTRLPVVSFR
jgi:hypothetical protein